VDVSRRLKRERRWPKKKRASEDGHTEMSMYKSAETRDFHKSQVMMTAIDTPVACAAEAPPRRKDCPVYLTPGDVEMLSSTKRRNSQSVIILLTNFGPRRRIVFRDQYKAVTHGHVTFSTPLQPEPRYLLHSSVVMVVLTKNESERIKKKLESVRGLGPR
jgi:hypothetical protein